MAFVVTEAEVHILRVFRQGADMEAVWTGGAGVEAASNE